MANASLLLIFSTPPPSSPSPSSLSSSLASSSSSSPPFSPQTVLPHHHYRPPVDPLISARDLQLAVYVLLYLRYLAVVLAIPLTALNLLVFAQPRMRNATSVYVIGLSLAQLYYVLVTSALSVMQSWLDDAANNYGLALYNLYVSVYGGIVVRRASYLVMGLVSLERLYAIVRPLHAKGFLLSRRPWLCLSLSYAFTALVHVYILTKTVVTQSVRDDGKAVVRFVPTRLYLQHKPVNDAFSLAAKVLLTYSALVFLIFLNALTVFCLKRHNVTSSKAFGASSSNDDVKKAQERQLTVTILAATISYVILSLPAAAHNLVYTVMPETYGAYGTYGNTYVMVYNLAFVLTVLSSAVDFFCFYVLSSNYRTTLYGIVGRLKLRTARHAAQLASVDSARQCSEMSSNTRMMTLS